MDTFFSLLKKGLVATVFIMFAFVATYIPQPYNNVQEAEAGGGGVGGATLPMQIVQNVNLIATNVATTASAGFDKITSWATGSLWVKENVLDGIGWALAKRLVSSMVGSLINWINSGFSGSPAFVQDLQGFLLQAADEVIGEYLQDLGGIGSFVCSPFRLDVQVSVAMQYERARADGGSGQPAPTCTLSGVIDNIEGFIGGSFEEGGWKDWFRITSTPQTYTPYGSALAAQAGARARIINAQGEELELLGFGDGFLSGEICETVHGAGTTKQDCFISKPGKVIQEALSFNLDSGRQSLIQADEINEVISALLGQLANTVLEGTAGILGLSSGTGYSSNYAWSGYSASGGNAVTDQLVASSTENFDFAQAETLIAEALVVQLEYRNLAITYEKQLNDYAANPGNSSNRRNLARDARDDARNILIDLVGPVVSTVFTTYGSPTAPTALPDSVIGRLTDINAGLQDPATTESQRLDLIQEYTEIDVYTESDVTTSKTNWDTLLR